VPAITEDQLDDFETDHDTEQVGFILFE
jgi:hypothetical protein